MKRDKQSLSSELTSYLQCCVKKKTIFEGVKKVNPFRIALFSYPYIVTESIERGYYPSCYVIKFDILLSGIVEVFLNGKEITSTMQYAKEIECSSIHRETNIHNNVGALSKYYYSIHRAFCYKINNSSINEK